MIRREVVAVNGMLDRAKEQSDEMAGLGTSLPVLNSQLKDVTMLIDSIDTIRPEIGEDPCSSHTFVMKFTFLTPSFQPP